MFTLCFAGTPNAPKRSSVFRLSDVKLASLLSACAVCLCFICGATSTPAAEDLVPEDTCIVDVQAPAGAVVMLDGRRYSTQRKFTYRNLEAGKLIPAQLKIDVGNRQIGKRLLLRGGWNVKVAIPPDRAPTLAPQTGHTGIARYVVQSKDGRYVATGNHRAAIIWDARTGRQLRRLKYFGTWGSLAINGDGSRILAAIENENRAILWDTSTGRMLRMFAREASHVNATPNAAAITPDSRYAALGCDDGIAIIWDATNGQRLRTLAHDTLAKGEVNFIRCICLSDDGRRCLTGTRDGIARLWDVDTGRVLRQFRHHDIVNSVYMSEDGERLVTGSEDQTATLWDANSGRAIRSFDTGSVVTDVALTDDGRRVLAKDNVRALTIWDVETGRLLSNWEIYGRGLIANTDGSRVILAGTAPFVLDAATGEQIDKYGASADAVSSVALSHDGRRLFTGSMHAVNVWDTSTGQRVISHSGYDDGPYVYQRPATMSVNGALIVTSDSASSSKLWSVETGKNLRTFDTERIFDATLSPDGSLLLGMRSQDDRSRVAALFDGQTGQQIRTFRAKNSILAAEFHPDGTQILTGPTRSLEESPGTMVLWETASGRKIREFEGQLDVEVRDIEFSPDGSLAAACSGNLVALWRTKSGRKLHAIKGHKKNVWGVTFSPDGRFLLSAGEDGAILWDLISERELRRFHENAATGSAVFSSDGRLIASQIADMCYVRDVSTGEEVCRIYSLDKGKNWVVLTPEGLFDGSPGGRQTVNYRVGEGLTVVPVDRFFQDFYYPGLLAAIWRGERPMPVADFSNLAKSRPPKLRVVNPAEGGDVVGSQIDVSVEVTERGGGVSGPWLRHNGARVQATTKTRREGESILHTFPLTLVEGENRLRVEAASGNGAWESEPVTLTLNLLTKLEKPDLYVLAVGVNQYADEAMNLQFAVRDIQAMTKVFRERGSSLYEKVHITELTNGDATRRKIRAALRDMADKARPQDALLVHLSGHGFTVGQRYYFIPHEFEQQSRRFEDDVRDFGYPSDELADAIGEVPALKRVLVLDTCNSGSALAKSDSRSRNPFAFRGAIERLSRAQGIFTLAASSSSEETVEIRQLGHGVLTYSLLAGLNAVGQGPLAGKPVKSDKQAVSVLDWFGYANEQVPQLTKQFLGQAQDVKMSGEGTGFPILPLAR